MKRKLGQRAAVIGASISGLTMAGVLAPYFEQIVIVERDLLSDAAEPRSGVPQGNHAHGLLAGGLNALDEIFPGYRKSLIEAGAVPVEMAREFRYERADVGALPQRPLDILLLSASRPLMESVLRRHIEAFRNIEIRTECRAARIAWSLHDEAVAGVEIRSELVAIELLTADLVIDASGRGGLTMALLEDLGRERPDLEEIGVDISYATAIVNIPANHYLDCKLAFTLPHPPKQGSLGLVMPIEQRRWMVTIGQRGASERLDNWEKMLSASRDLVTTTIHDAVCNLTPVKDIHHYAFPASSWRHFERLPALPRGVLPSAMQSVASIRFMAKECHLRRCKRSCCGNLLNWLMPGLTQSPRCRQSSWDGSVVSRNPLGVVHKRRSEIFRHPRRAARQFRADRPVRGRGVSSHCRGPGCSQSDGRSRSFAEAAELASRARHCSSN